YSVPTDHPFNHSRFVSMTGLMPVMPPHEHAYARLFASQVFQENFMDKPLLPLVPAIAAILANKHKPHRAGCTTIDKVNRAKKNREAVDCYSQITIRHVKGDASGDGDDDDREQQQQQQLELVE